MQGKRYPVEVTIKYPKGRERAFKEARSFRWDQEHRGEGKAVPQPRKSGGRGSWRESDTGRRGGVA